MPPQKHHSSTRAASSVGSTPGTQEEPLVDLTLKLQPRGKRIERLQKRLDKKNEKKKGSGEPKRLLDLPLEIFREIISHLQPSDIFRLARVNKPLNEFVTQQDANIAKSVISWRYPVLEQCFRIPVPLEYVDPVAYPALQFEGRGQIQQMRNKPYQHILSPDPQVLCTCLSCILRWNALNLIVDFAHFQVHLDKGEPIPMIPRGKNPKWNQKRITLNALVVARALQSDLWYACILQTHLESTVNSIRRHTNNKGNQRPRYRMTAEDATSGTDRFLDRSGPPTADFPFHRDNYYLLESYFPNRGWSEEQKWVYVPASQHDRDVEMVLRYDPYLREQAALTAARATRSDTDISK
jgi:hypothetical protein